MFPIPVDTSLMVTVMVYTQQSTVVKVEAGEGVLSRSKQVLGRPLVRLVTRQCGHALSNVANKGRGAVRDNEL